MKTADSMTEKELRVLASQPLFFEKNRVFRVYKGGKQFSALCGDDSEDTMFPEEWIASKVKAINPKYFGERDGVSVIRNTNIFFDDFLNLYPDLLLGGKKYDCLVKYLDSAIRLPVQVHPTKEFSKKYFSSEYGKTEAWLVLATRENARLYFGFNREIDKEEFSALEEKSLKERDIMRSVLSYTDVKPGDLYIIRAGMIHAIGAGCTILEVQEPTDFTIQPENWCGDYKISEEEKYIGLSKSDALDCFDYSLVGEKALGLSALSPATVYEKDGLKKEVLISYEDTPCFAENRYTLTGGSLILNNAPAVYILSDGEIELNGEDYSRKVVKGEYFFLPHAAAGKFRANGNGIIIECLPSYQNL